MSYWAWYFFYRYDCSEFHITNIDKREKKNIKIIRINLSKDRSLLLILHRFRNTIIVP